MWKQALALVGVLGFVGGSMAVDARQTVTASLDEVAAVGAPAALLCEEQSATLGEGDWIFGSRRDPLTDVYALVSDPSGACDHPDVRRAAGYDAEGGSCYILRTIGTGEPDRPMSCLERAAGGDRENGVALLECSGWDMRLNAMVDGGFAMASSASADLEARSSRGVCSAL
ncbi:MAG: hypothetical protein AAFV96_08325 [Pseudomonadota bacterium]